MNAPLPDICYDLEKRFSYHTPDQLKKEVHEIFRENCKALAYTISVMIPSGREQALALTHLEEVMMWGNAGIARS